MCVERVFFHGDVFSIIILLLPSAKEIKLITNAEVYEALQECNDERMLSGSGEFPWTKAAVTRYLEMTPASHLSREK